jgi:hypothetical protein
MTTYARSPVDGHVLCCRRHDQPVPYVERDGVIIPCPWPQCSNGTSLSVLELGDVVFTRCRAGDRWQWGELPRDQPELEVVSVMDLQRWLEDQARRHELHPEPSSGIAIAALRWVASELGQVGVRWAVLGGLPHRRALGDQLPPPPLGGDGFPPT